MDIQPKISNGEDEIPSLQKAASVPHLFTNGVSSNSKVTKQHLGILLKIFLIVVLGLGPLDILNF